MVTEINGQLFYTVDEFAAIVRVSVSTVERWMSDHTISYWQPRPGAQKRIPATEISKYVVEAIKQPERE